MIVPSDIRLGVVIAQNGNRYVYNTAAEVYAPLLGRGCSEANLQMKVVPGDFDVVLGTLFFAEYTDVDGVIVVCEKHDPAIASALLDLQIQWNMPVEYRYGGSNDGNGYNIVEMIRLQSEMADDVPESKTPQSRKESVN